MQINFKAKLNYFRSLYFNYFDIPAKKVSMQMQKSATIFRVLDLKKNSLLREPTHVYFDPKIRW
jgi:hypothetical protein